MRKHQGLLLPVLLQMLFSLGFVATASSDPIVPWPLEANHEYLYSQDIEGTWIAFDRGNERLWFVKIVKSNIKSNSSIVISLLGRTSSPQSGWLVPVDGVFAGKVNISKGHESPLMIFKNLDGLYLRLETTKNNYQDFVLYPVSLEPAN